MSYDDRDGFKLCFVDEWWAYFSDVDPIEISGDDWDDAPHECNASHPYPKDDQEILKVAYDGDLWVVGNAAGSDRGVGRWGYLSADQINRGEAPWLVKFSFGDVDESGRIAIDFPIMAGTTLSRFRELIAMADGRVYCA